MERHLELRDSKELYQVSMDAGELEREPIVLEKNGEPVAAVISYDEFRAYRKWKKQTPHRELPEYFLKDQKVFRQMLPSLLETHRDKWVAIYQGEIVDQADKLGELADRVYAKYGYRAIYMDQVTEPRVYRIPSIRVVRP
jgi:hypothetical protein